MYLMTSFIAPLSTNIYTLSSSKRADPLRDMFRRLAVKYSVNIIGGSHPAVVGNTIRNVPYIALRDGGHREFKNSDIIRSSIQRCRAFRGHRAQGNSSRPKKVIL